MRASLWLQAAARDEGAPFKLMAMYRTGGVAACWESAGGGFVQHPTGSLMLRYDARAGTGQSK